MTPEQSDESEHAAGSDQPDEAEVNDALELLFRGRVEELIPPEELGEFHDFIREEAIRRRRFAVSFRLDCRCLAWIGYAMSNVVTHEEGVEFVAKATQSFIPDHEADVEHPEGATEDPPEAFEDWPIWPFEIYQDEAAGSDEGEDFDEKLDELATEPGFDKGDDLAGIRTAAADEDPPATDEPGV